MNFVSMYLAGNIPKNHEKSSKVAWTEEDFEKIRTVLKPNHVSFLNPAIRKDDLNDEKGVFGRDMAQVYCADLVFVDARERRGLGVGAEMMWAKVNDIPVITLAPHNTHYHKDEVILLGEKLTDYVHQFVASLSDAVVESVEEGAEWILKYINGEISSIKGHQDIKEAMAHYKKVRFNDDQPMKEVSTLNQSLRAKINQLSALV